MSITERFFPIIRRQNSFFDPFRSHMQNEFKSMEQQMMSMQEHMERQTEQMRRQMFQLQPYEPSGSVIPELQPRHPIIEEKGQAKLKLDFNVQGFKPEEVHVKLLGNHILQVTAKNDTKSTTGETHRTYLRQYTLPEGIKSDEIKPQMSSDGVLTIEAPAPNLKESEKMIPIQYIGGK